MIRAGFGRWVSPQPDLTLIEFSTHFPFGHNAIPHWPLVDSGSLCRYFRLETGPLKR